MRARVVGRVLRDARRGRRELVGRRVLRAAGAQADGAPAIAPGAGGSLAAASLDTARALNLIAAYQRRGHENANLDPLGLWRQGQQLADLDYKTYGFAEADLDRGLSLAPLGAVGAVSGLMNNADFNGDGETTLRELLTFLEQTYCGTIGVECEHITDLEKLNWIRERVEVHPPPMAKETKHQLLERLAFSEKFEAVLAVKFNSAKRFGLEGCESMIPGLKAMVDEATTLGVEDVCIGMAHRGRLNVLSNVIRKPMEMIFKEFRGTAHVMAEEDPDDDSWTLSGDVKYHLGTALDRSYPDGRTVHMALLPNPSHLEAVNPLVVGKCRAKMDLKGDATGRKVMPVIIHGDAAFAGQGIVYETMQLSEIAGYQTGGTINVICNNQVGFTAHPEQGRSTPYCVDVAKAIQAPIFHVNGDDVEAVARVCKLAAQWRHAVPHDVVIDIVCYRKHGHNELDQPMFTQPLMYTAIAPQDARLQKVHERLIAEGVVTTRWSRAEIDGVLNSSRARRSRTRSSRPKTYETPEDNWKHVQLEAHAAAERGPGPLRGRARARSTSWRRIGAALDHTPEGFAVHKRLDRQLKAKVSRCSRGQRDGRPRRQGHRLGARPSSLAFGTCLLEGNRCASRARTSSAARSRTATRSRPTRRRARSTSSSTTCDRARREGARQDLHRELAALRPRRGARGASARARRLLAPRARSQTVPLALPRALIMQVRRARLRARLLDGDARRARRVGGAVRRLRQRRADHHRPVHLGGRGQVDAPVGARDAAAARLPGPGARALVVPHRALPAVLGRGPRPRAARPRHGRRPAAPGPARQLADRQRLDARQLLPRAAPPAPPRVPQAAHRRGHQGAAARRARGLAARRLRPGLVVPVRHQRGRAREARRRREDPPRRHVLGQDLLRAAQAAPRGRLRRRRARAARAVLAVPLQRGRASCARHRARSSAWCQEEPKNMGAWYFVRDRLLTTTRTINEKVLRPAYVGRRTMASPAEGYGDVHLREQSKILKTALGTEVSAFPFGCAGAARRAALLNVLLRTPDPARAPLQVHRGQRLPRGGVSNKQRADSADPATRRH